MRHDEPQRELALLIVATATLTGGLHLLGGVQGFRVEWSDPIGWLSSASPDEAIAALLRSIGIAMGYWIGGSAALYALTTRVGSRTPRLIRIVTFPGVRRVVDRAMAATLAASLAATPFTPALADEPPPPPVVFDISAEGVPVPHVRMATDTSPPEPVAPATPNGEDTRAALVSPTLVVPIPPVAGASAQPEPTSPVTVETPASTHTVDDGDNLWIIADRQLRATTTEPTTSALASYWRQVIAANRSTLRSGDPNLIYPGEIVTLPPVEVSQ